MPVYDYKCTEHGLFYELASMSDSAEPCPCPKCGHLAPRVIMIAPALQAMLDTNREAHARNEESRHKPVVSTLAYREEKAALAKHAGKQGCGCHDRPIRQSALMYTADGNKMFPSMRPWMISH